MPVSLPSTAAALPTGRPLDSGAPQTRRFSALLAAVLALNSCWTTGCVTGVEVDDQSKKLSSQITTARVPGYYCAPVDLAKAEANIAFAKDESERGDMLNARAHLAAAKKHTERVWAVKDQKGCCPDKDGDKLCDAEDKCPDDPEDMDNDQDDDGCPEYDRDGDGIHDQLDRCPDQPEDKDGFLDEDGCPEEDNDGDGILDKADKCVNHAEDKDNFDDKDGCPDFDNDGDGIADAPQKLDQCPDQPEVFNGLDDTDGCPDKLPDLPPPAPPPPEFKNIVVEQDRIVFKKQILFATNSAKIVGALSEEILDECSQALKTRKEVKVQVEGHTDERGPDKKNKKLSQARAESVVKALVTRGIARSRLIPIGFGEEKPIDPGHNEAAWDQNRRVEFNFLMEEK